MFGAVSIRAMNAMLDCCRSTGDTMMPRTEPFLSWSCFVIHKVHVIDLGTGFVITHEKLATIIASVTEIFPNFGLLDFFQLFLFVFCRLLLLDSI